MFFCQFPPTFPGELYLNHTMASLPHTGPASLTLILNSKGGEGRETPLKLNHPFYLILFCHVLTAFLSLLSLAGHRDKLKIKSTRKIIYKKHSQAPLSIPTAQLGNPSSLHREEGQCFPPPHPC